MSLAVLSTSTSKEKRKLMEFSDKWGDGPVFNWYRALKVSSTTVTHLEIRINDGTPPHRFVLVYLENGPVFCFDRHPETAKPGTLVLETLGGLSTRKAADNYSELNQEDLEDLKNSTHCELDLTTPPNTDLLHVISACFALSQDEEARDYALLKYNCYFFSWTLVMIVARQMLPFFMPSPDEVTERAAPALKNLTDSVTDKMINFLLTLVLHTITGFRVRLGRGIIGGLRKRGAVVWALPTCAVRFVLCQALRYQLSKGIREKLRQKAQSQLEDSLKRMFEGLLGQQDVVGEQLLKIFWNVILDIISFTTIASDMETTEISHTPDDPLWRTIRVKRRLIGDFQFVKMWNDALNAPLPAARKKAYDQANSSMFANTQEMHSKMFNIAFDAALDAALEAAKKAAEDTKE
ncbi:hypothetical protein RSOLAG22IIIB_11873 [Rhizoctonia solani]|uniref:Uncharacterized protein n=1 Tax=Rhizoctonia solani TaxID=456999 RepID=A0A0K6GAH5_9AGAM|nr:hypothetical protein RSOLAG22IIIB_11873 [Rhizoctonia solani]